MLYEEQASYSFLFLKTITLLLNWQLLEEILEEELDVNYA
jgi:hypothetical protein